MSDIPNCVKGGISVTWKIENFLSTPRLNTTSTELKWTKVESKWSLHFSRRKNIDADDHAGDKCIELTIKKLDELPPFKLSGIICAVVKKYSFELSRFVSHDFRNGKAYTKLVEQVDWEKEGLIYNGALILCFNCWDPDINDLLSAEYFICSKYIQQTCLFEWAIQGISYEYKASCSIIIPRKFRDFFTFKDHNLKLSLFIITDKIVIAHITSPGSEMFSFKCKFQFRNIEESHRTFLDTGWRGKLMCVKTCDFHYSRLLTEEEKDYLKKKSIIECDIVAVSDCLGVIENICYKPKTRKLNIKAKTRYEEKFSNDSLQQSMYSLYKESKFCDIMIRSGTATFKCHKAILCGRSLVLRTMFENDMIEKETGVVNIDDVEPQILSNFLIYLYTDLLEEMDIDSVTKLYVVADKYAVLSLREKCRNVIKSSLSNDNVCEALDLADSHHDADLKEEILSYFLEHTKEIVNSNSWKNLLAIKPSLAAETLQAAVSYMLQ